MADDFDESTDIDPQSARAGQGLKQAGQAFMQSKPVQDIISGAPLAEYQNMVHQAIAGNKEAQLALARHSLGMAAGTLKNVELPMDEASRLARAKEMGFDTENTWFHGSTKDLKKFDPKKFGNDVKYGKGAYLTNDPQHAELYTTGYPSTDSVMAEPLPGGNITPTFLSVKNPLNLEENIPEKLGRDIWMELKKVNPKLAKNAAAKRNYLNEYPGRSILEAAQANGVSSQTITDLAKKHGYDSIRLKDQITVFDPSQVRSKFGAFDPSKSGSGNLSYAAGGMVDAQPLSVLINSETGLAENLPQEQANAALSQGTHEIPLVDPQGQHVSAPLSAAQDLLSQGYAQPNEDQLKQLTDYAKYSSTPEQLKTFLEGAAEAGTFGLSSAAERAAGVTPEAMRSRREINPGVHSAGQVAGLAGSAFIPGAGEANILQGAGEAAAKAAGFGAETLGSRLATRAIKNAAETAIIQTGDEVSKMIIQDPHQSLGTAVTDIGLSAVLGGALGAGLGTVPEAWNAAKGSKTAKYLSALKSKVDNRFGEAAIQAPLDAAKAANVTMDPAITAALGDTPEANQLFQDLVATPGTFASRALKEKLSNFEGQLKESALNAVGKSEDNLTNIAAQSTAEIGKQAQKTFSNEINQKFGPAIETMETFKNTHGDSPLGDTVKNKIKEDIGQVIQNNRWHVHTDDPAAKFAYGLMEKADKLENIKDLQEEMKYISGKYGNMELRHAAGQLKPVFRDAENSTLDQLIGEKAPDQMAALKQARAQYGEASKLVDNFNDYLHVGKYIGPKTFIQSVGEMDPEVFLNRLSNENRANLLQALETTPETKKIIQSGHLNDALADAVKNGEFNAKAFTKKVGAWSPELRQFALPEGADKKLAAIKTLYDRVPTLLNPSGTAGALDKIMSQMPSGVMSVLSMVMGHGAIWGFLSGQLMRLIGREAPDALKLATLKFLGSSEPLSAPAFKASVEYLHSVVKGDALVSRATKNLFQAGKDVLPTTAIPSHKEIKRLDSRLQKLQANPAPLLDIGGHTPHYLPEHGQSMGQLASNAVQYLNGLRPDTSTMGPLGAAVVPSQNELAQYHRQLAIAQQPLMIVEHMKTGTITPTDLNTFKTLYPELSDRITQKIMSEVIDKKSQGYAIPYKTKMMLSMFSGQDLDSSLTQQFLAFNQMTLAGHGAAQSANAANQAIKTSQKGLSSINQADRLRTPMQAAALRERA